MKIAINGAGVAGPALAHWLHRGGHAPTLIEKSPHFRAGGYIIDFWGVGYTIAERMGILPEVREKGYSVREVRFVDERGRKTGGFHSEVFRRMTGDRFTSLPRGDLAAAIYHTVNDQVETIFGDSFSAIDSHDTGVRASFEKGAARDFDLVIGADGLHSAVRDLAFGPRASSRSSSVTALPPSRSRATGRATSWFTSAMGCPAGKSPASPCAMTGRCFSASLPRST